MSASQRSWSTKAPLALGFFAIVVLVLGLGAWSAKMNIAGAVVTPGVIEVESHRQVVQHPDGGVIVEILVDDGDVVEANDILIRLYDGFLQSDVSVISEQLFEISARKARLVAERDGSEVINFDQILMRASGNPAVAELVEGQTNLFFARMESLAREEALLHERELQLTEQVHGAEARRAAIIRQRDLISEELTDEVSLLAKGLSQSRIVRGLQREAVSLEGLEAGVTATIAERRSRIVETEIEILRLHSNRRGEAITTLRDLQYREVELRETQTSLRRKLRGMDVRAPSSGIVYGRQFHTLGAVVGQGEPILQIVPQDSPLVITAKVWAIHIDQVQVGQEVSLHLSAFDMRTTPIILGEISKVSSDVYVDERTGVPYYAIEVVPDKAEMENLESLRVLPGMPVQVFVKTADRTLLEYLIKPLAMYFGKAFRGR